MNANEIFWERQYNNYKKQNYSPKIRYESWQPGRWAANRSAVSILRSYINGIESSCEVGAGSAAFSFELKKQLNIDIAGIDMCENAMKYAMAISEDMQLPINYIKEDLFKSDYTADLILSLGVIEHLEHKKQIELLKKCAEMSKKYVLTAIPNQQSEIFVNYVTWANKESQSYEEEHQPLTTNALIDLIQEIGMKIVHVDGFQIFLSELGFWNETDTSQFLLYRNLISKFSGSKDKWANFPNISFEYGDIKKMCEIETALSTVERLENGFMTYVLAEK